MDINDYYKGKNIKASELKAPIKLTVKDVYAKTFEGDDSPTVMVQFQGTDQELALNVTNKNLMLNIMGSSETDDWKGMSIEIYTVDTEFKGKPCKGIRVRAPGADPSF